VDVRHTDRELNFSETFEQGVFETRDCVRCRTFVFVCSIWDDKNNC
jgi:hypothetical protein